MSIVRIQHSIFCLTDLLFQRSIQVRPGPPLPQKELWELLTTDF